jgi:hypothetical protein
MLYVAIVLLSISAALVLSAVIYVCIFCDLLESKYRNKKNGKKNLFFHGNNKISSTYSYSVEQNNKLN